MNEKLDQMEIDKELNRQIEADPSKFIEFHDMNGKKLESQNLIKQENSENFVVKENNQSSFGKENDDGHKDKKESKHKK